MDCCAPLFAGQSSVSPELSAREDSSLFQLLSTWCPQRIQPPDTDFRLRLSVARVQREVLEGPAEMRNQLPGAACAADTSPSASVLRGPFAVGDAIAFAHVRVTSWMSARSCARLQHLAGYTATHLACVVKELLVSTTLMVSRVSPLPPTLATSGVRQALTISLSFMRPLFSSRVAS